MKLQLNVYFTLVHKNLYIYINALGYSLLLTLATALLLFQMLPLFNASNTSGLYYKHIMIVNYASSIINKLKALVTDDTRVIIYDRHVFIVQATGLLH
jgi:hypothetical protein